MDTGQSFGGFLGADGVAYGDILNPGHHNNIAGLCLFHVLHGLALVYLNAGRLERAYRSVGADTGKSIPGAGFAVENASYSQTAEIV